MFAAPLLAEEGASGIGALGIDPASLLVYLLNFGVLLAILYFVGYKRILGMLDQRSGRIREKTRTEEACCTGVEWRVFGIPLVPPRPRIPAVHRFMLPMMVKCRWV